MRLHSDYYCNGDIASQVGSYKSQIQGFLYREKKNACLPPKPIIIHHLVEGALALAFALNTEADEHPRYGRNRLRQQLIEDHTEFSNVPSVRTLSCYLKGHAFNHDKLVKKPLLSPENVKCRLEFATEYVGKDLDSWKKVVFSVEMTVQSVPNVIDVFAWTRKTAKPYERPKNYQVQGGGFKVCFWGCFSRFGVGPLVPQFVNVRTDGYIQTMDL
jgi:hypothetical protein